MKLAALGVASAACSAVALGKERNIRSGRTGIIRLNDVAQAITDTRGLGFYGFETSRDVLTKWESQGGLGPLREQNHLSLIFGYCTLNFDDPSKRRDEMEKAVTDLGLSVVLHQHIGTCAESRDET
jgi:inosose dehydratase